MSLMSPASTVVFFTTAPIWAAQPWDRTQVFHIAGRFFTVLAPGKPRKSLMINMNLSDELWEIVQRLSPTVALSYLSWNWVFYLCHYV